MFKCKTGDRPNDWQSVTTHSTTDGKVTFNLRTDPILTTHTHTHDGVFTIYWQVCTTHAMYTQQPKTGLFANVAGQTHVCVNHGGVGFLSFFFPNVNPSKLSETPLLFVFVVFVLCEGSGTAVDTQICGALIPNLLASRALVF